MSFAPSHLSGPGYARSLAAAPSLLAKRNGTLGLAVWLGAATSLTIAAALVGGKAMALASIPPLVLAVAAFARRDPMVAIVLLFTYMAMEGMYKYLTFFSQAIYVIRPLLFLMILAGWGLWLRAREARLQFPPLSLAAALFVGWGLIEIFNPSSVGLVNGFATLFLFYAGPLLFYLIGYNVVRTSRQVEMFCYVLIAVCTVVSAFAVVQFALGKAWTEAHFPGYATILQSDWFAMDAVGRVVAASFRPASTTSMSGGGAAWAHLGTLAAVGLLFSPAVPMKRKSVLAFCLVVNVLGLLVSGVRLWLVIAIFEALFFFLIVSRHPRTLIRNLGVLLVIGATGGIAYVGAQSISGGIIAHRYADTLSNPLAKFQKDRGSNVTAFLDMVSEYPLGLGYLYGLGKTDLSASAADPNSTLRLRNAETQFGAIMGDMGVPGLLLLLGLLIGSVANGWRAFQQMQSPHLRIIAAMLFTSLVGYLPTCFAGPVMQGTVHFWFVAAILVVLPRVEKIEQRLSEPDRARS